MVVTGADRRGQSGREGNGHVCLRQPGHTGTLIAPPVLVAEVSSLEPLM